MGNSDQAASICITISDGFSSPGSSVYIKNSNSIQAAPPLSAIQRCLKIDKVPNQILNNFVILYVVEMNENLPVLCS